MLRAWLRTGPQVTQPKSFHRDNPSPYMQLLRLHDERVGVWKGTETGVLDVRRGQVRQAQHGIHLQRTETAAPQTSSSNQGCVYVCVCERAARKQHMQDDECTSGKEKKTNTHLWVERARLHTRVHVS